MSAYERVRWADALIAFAPADYKFHKTMMPASAREFYTSLQAQRAPARLRDEVKTNTPLRARVVNQGVTTKSAGR